MFITRPPPRRAARGEGVDDIVHVHVIAGLAAIAEHDARPPRDEVAGKDRDDAGLAVGVLTRPVDVREGKGGELEPVQLAISDEVVDGRLLRHAVGRQGPVRLMFVDGKVRALGLAVQRASGSREDDLRRPRCASTLEDLDSAENVDLGVEHRPVDRDADVGLGGQVEDHLRAAVAHQVDEITRADVKVVKSHRAAEGAGVGEVGERSRRQVVHDLDLVAFGEKAVDEIRPDEPSTSGHHCSHGVRLRSRAASGQWVTRAVEHRHRRHLGPDADNCHPAQAGPFADEGAGTDDAVLHNGIRADLGTWHQHRTTDDATGPDS